MRIRRFLFLLLLVPCFFHALSPRVFCAEPESGSMDLVLLIDMSGSMKYTDPDCMAEEGALLFMDLLKEDAAQVCIIGFSDKVEILRPLSKLQMQAERDEIRNALHAYPRERDTDLGAALLTAVEVLQDRKQSDNAAILLFTDGCIDLPSNEDLERSRQDAKEAARMAAEASIPLYCIGLDKEENASAYHLDRALLEELSDTGDGTFRYVTEADLLPDLFHQVVADCFDSTTGRIGDLAVGASEALSELSFEIPDRSAARANVILLPTGGEITEDLFQEGKITLTDPSGKALRPEDDIRLRIRSSPAYLVLKLADPMPGVWKLRAQGDIPFHVHVNLLFLYELEIEASAEESDDGKVQISAWFTRRGERIRDPELYRNYQASAEISLKHVPRLWIQEHFPEARPADGAGETEFEIQLKASPDGDGYSGTLDAWPGMDSGIRIIARSDRYEVTGGRIDFTSGGSGDIIVGNLPDEICLDSMFSGKTVSGIRPEDWFQAWDDSRLTVSAVSSDESVLSVGMDDGELHLSGNRNGRTSLCLTVRDRYGSCYKIRIPVAVRIRMEGILRLLPGAGAAAAAALLLLILALRIRGRMRLNGSLVLSLTPERNGAEEFVCPLPGGDRKVTLAEVIRSGAHPKLIQEPLLGMLRVDRVLICGGIHGKGIVLSLKTRAEDTKLADCFGRNVRRTLLRDGDTFELASEKAKKEPDRYPKGGILFGYYDDAGGPQRGAEEGFLRNARRTRN